jgi:hypothetical protein
MIAGKGRIEGGRTERANGLQVDATLAAASSTSPAGTVLTALGHRMQAVMPQAAEKGSANEL